ncbi:conserved hypothetical protein [Microbacterium sp. 8M]|nr:conserved hypothetical protein [Microbacterium sp. 8M]
MERHLGVPAAGADPRGRVERLRRRGLPRQRRQPRVQRRPAARLGLPVAGDLRRHRLGRQPHAPDGRRILEQQGLAARHDQPARRRARAELGARAVRRALTRHRKRETSLTARRERRFPSHASGAGPHGRRESRIRTAGAPLNRILPGGNWTMSNNDVACRRR